MKNEQTNSRKVNKQLDYSYTSEYFVEPAMCQVFARDTLIDIRIISNKNLIYSWPVVIVKKKCLQSPLI